MLVLNAHYGERKLEIKLDNNNVDHQASIITSIMNQLFFERPEVKLEVTEKEDSKIVQYKEGYEALKTDQTGLHHPKSEFKTAQIKGKLGVKEKGGEKLYQTFYRCTQCSHTGKHFLPKGRVYCTCHDCGKRMNIREAAVKGFPHQDEFGNYYIAGDYKKTLFDKEQEEKLQRA